MILQKIIGYLFFLIFVLMLAVILLAYFEQKIVDIRVVNSFLWILALPAVFFLGKEVLGEWDLRKAEHRIKLQYKNYTWALIGAALSFLFLDIYGYSFSWMLIYLLAVCYYLKIDMRIFFLGALIALGFVVGYLVLGLSSQAEQVSILVYYCLVLGVLGEILQNILKSQKNSHHHESSHFIDYEK